MENKNYDSEFCGSIPIATINSIQSYGFLIVADKNFKVIQVSENIERFLKIPKESILNKNLSEFIASENFNHVKSKVASQLKNTVPFYVNFNTGGSNNTFIALIHLHQDFIQIEFEPIEKEEIPFSEVNYEIKNIAGIIRAAKSKVEVLALACKEIKEFSGFDRVLIYEFDKEWNGKVVAEAKDESSGFETYLGLMFPASDIPRQARHLYYSNPFRYIPDRNYHPSKLIPEINPMTNGYTDLSRCNLRGVVPVHIEYLGNMDISTSMSIPVIMNNELWGLVSCHHRTSRTINYQIRSSFEILTSIISAEITSRETERQLRERLALEGIRNQLLKKLDSGHLPSVLNDQVSLMSLLNLSGAAIALENELHVFGKTPEKEQIYRILDWVNKQQLSGIFFTNQLPSVMDGSAEFKDLASGLIVIPVSAERNEHILGFQPEVTQEIIWGGNPNEAINFEANKKDYHPRNSFSQWKETVRDTSAGWNSVELEMAESFRHSFLEYILKIQTYKRVIAEEEAFKLSIVANNTTNLVLILDNQRKIEWANAAFLNTLGFKLETIKGKFFTFVFSSFLGVGEINQSLDDIEGIYTPFSREIVMKIRENHVFIKLNFSPLLNEKKELFKYIIVGVDITEVKEQAIELQTINAELDKFAYLVSHDLKAPLKSIEALTDLLRTDIQEKKFEEVKGYVDLIQKSAQRMNLFITDILAYSRIAKDKRVHSQISLKNMVEDIVQTLNPPSSYKVYIQPDLPEIKGNNLEVFQIFSNLLSNAFKYVNREDAEIEVYYNLLDNNYLFTIKDNGPGIEPEYTEKIFDMFETIPSSKKEGSTGIGLASVKKVIQGLGGKIWVDSSPGKGSAFKFTLPISA